MVKKGLMAALTCLAGTAAQVHAAPVTYDFTSGFVTLSADVTNSGVTTDLLPAGTQIKLTGGQLTFDATALTLPSFQFLDNAPTTVALNTMGPLLGEKITLASLIVGPSATYSSSAFLSSSPPPTFGFSAGEIDGSGIYSLSGPVARGNTAFAGTNNSLSGQITLGGADMIQLTGITLGSFMMGGTSVTLKGDIVFEGATPVPLPASVWMLGSVLALFGFAFMDRRGASFRNSWKLQS